MILNRMQRPCRCSPSDSRQLLHVTINRLPCAENQKDEMHLPLCPCPSINAMHLTWEVLMGS
jgi:hypothetical protein